jgi:uncharacterized phage protein (TIGR02220 family)
MPPGTGVLALVNWRQSRIWIMSIISSYAAQEIVEHLNAKAGRKFRLIPTYLTPIRHRLEEVDNDVDGIKEMIDRQCALWKCDDHMATFLNPTTLFRPSNFHRYYDDRDLPVASNKPVAPRVTPVWEMRKLLETKQSEYDRLTQQWDCLPMPDEVRVKWKAMRQSIDDLKAKIASTPI